MAAPTYRTLATIVQARSIANITADVVIEEQHEDRADISDLPVEQGSTITDNVVDLPYGVILTYGWSTASPQNKSQSQSFLRGIYTQLIQLKQSKVPFTILTGKRSYSSMLISAVTLTTDEHTENGLIVRLECRQIIVVTTSTFTIPQSKSQVAQPQKSLQTVPRGNQQVGTTTNATTQTSSQKPVEQNKTSPSIWSLMTGFLGGGPGA